MTTKRKTEDPSPEPTPAAPSPTPEAPPTPDKPATPPHPIRAIRRAGVPLAAIETPDPAATMATCTEALNGKQTECPILQWDLIQGLRARNEAGEQYLLTAGPDGQPLEPINTTNPAECLAALAKKPPVRGLVFFLSAHRLITPDPAGAFVAQGVWNCRDAFKAQGVGSTLILLAPSLTLPPELSRDVVTIAEPLPDRRQLEQITISTCQDASLTAPTGPELAGVLDTLTGLSAFEAEQTLALSISKAGIDRAGLWARKVRAIEQTPGLTVYKGKETLDDVGGNENAKRLMSDTLRGTLDCSCIVFIDELDKGMAAAGSDTSGTTQDQNKALLSYLQDFDALAALFLGPPGTGKTLLAKALAGQFQKPLIMLDLGALKSRYVGDSEANMRDALKKIHAMSEGRALWVGAANRDAGLPPELRRRFSYQLLFFDLPNRAEKDKAWNIHTNGLRFRGQKVALRADQTDRATLNDDGWTGAEIRNCCLKSYAMNISVAEAAKSIVPISKSAGEIVTALRKAATGRYISASYPGIYTYAETTSPAISAPAGRQFGT